MTSLSLSLALDTQALCSSLASFSIRHLLYILSTLHCSRLYSSTANQPSVFDQRPGNTGSQGARCTEQGQTKGFATPASQRPPSADSLRTSYASQKEAWRRGVTGFQLVPRKTTDMGTRHPHCRRLHLSKEQRRAQAGSRAGRDAGLRAPARPPSAAARGPATPTSTPTPPPTPTSTPTSTRRPTRPRPGARCPGGTPGLQEGRPGAAGVSGGRTGFPTLDTEKLLPAARPDSGRRSPTRSRSRSPRDGGSASERDRRGADGACSAARGGRRDSGGDPGSGSEKNSGWVRDWTTLSPQRSS